MSKRGFTLLEVLAATALAAMMMMMMMVVTASLRRHQRASHDADDAHRRDAAALVALLAEEFSAADTIRSEPGRLVLQGVMGLDQATLEPAPRPVEVRYLLVREPGNSSRGNVLVRQQQDLTARTTQAAWTQVLLADVAMFQVTLSSPEDGPPENRPANKREPATLVLQWAVPESAGEDEQGAKRRPQEPLRYEIGQDAADGGRS